MLATPPADCLRGLLVGRSLVEFALRYCQVLIELAKPRQIAGGQLHPRRGMTAGPEEEIALLMRRWEQVKAGDGAATALTTTTHAVSDKVDGGLPQASEGAEQHGHDRGKQQQHSGQG